MEPQAPEEPQLTYERDPFPKMILVCIAITLVLLVVIVMFLAAGFLARMRQQMESPESVPQPVEMAELGEIAVARALFRGGENC
jgi:hypothetical protein